MSQELIDAFSSTISAYWIGRYSLSSRLMIGLSGNGREGNRQITGKAGSHSKSIPVIGKNDRHIAGKGIHSFFLSERPNQTGEMAITVAISVLVGIATRRKFSPGNLFREEKS